MTPTDYRHAVARVETLEETVHWLAESDATPKQREAALVELKSAMRALDRLVDEATENERRAVFLELAIDS